MRRFSGVLPGGALRRIPARECAPAFFSCPKRKRAAPGTKKRSFLRPSLRTTGYVGQGPIQLRCTLGIDRMPAPQLWGFIKLHLAVGEPASASPSPPASLCFRGHLEKAAASKNFIQRPSTARVSGQAGEAAETSSQSTGEFSGQRGKAARAQCKHQRYGAAESSQARQHPVSCSR